MHLTHLTKILTAALWAMALQAASTIALAQEDVIRKNLAERIPDQLVGR